LEKGTDLAIGQSLPGESGYLQFLRAEEPDGRERPCRGDCAALGAFTGGPQFRRDL
jgi:hypothetical protein